jgi:hypothetical protein
MIEAADADLAGKKIDSYTCDLNGPNYQVTVAKGAKSGVGLGKSEEEAYDNALEDMSGGGSAASKK